MKPTILTFFAEKGGTGKTTLSFNLIGALAKKGKRVLAVDADKQGNLSKSFLPEEKVLSLHPGNTVAAIWDIKAVAMPDQLLHPASGVPGASAAGDGTVCIIPANRALANHLAPSAPWREQLEWRLAEFLRDAAESFDFVVIDTSPDIDGLPAWGALLASDFVLSPVEPAVYSTQSFNGVGLQVEAAQKKNPALCFLGFVFNRKDGRRKNHSEWVAAARNQAGSLIFETELRTLDPLSKAAERQLPIAFTTSRESAEARKQIEALTAEVLARIAAARQQSGHQGQGRPPGPPQDTTQDTTQNTPPGKNPGKKRRAAG